MNDENSKLLYTVYKTTNIVNGKFYIGVHATLNPDDDYLGSGSYLNRAINKYGKESFTKEVLAVFHNPTDMLDFEKWLVNDEFLKTANTYNLKTGGIGSFFYINHDPVIKQKRREAVLVGLNKYIRTSRNHFNNPEWQLKHNPMNTNPEWRKELSKKSQTPEARERRRNTLTKIQHQSGSKNSQFGTKWVFHPDSLVSKKVKQHEVDTYLRDGWTLGRRIKLNSITGGSDGESNPVSTGDSR